MNVLLTNIIILFMVVCPVFATGQEPDIIRFKGKEYSLYANPLEKYYETGRKRPRFMIRPSTISSGNWRGYVASWEIIKNRLYLSGIDSWVDGRKVSLQRLFGKKIKKGRVNASWYSGILRIPDGKQLQYVHMGYGSIYEREIIFTVEKGKVINQEIIDNTQRKIPSELELQRQELEKMKPKKNATKHPVM